MTPPRHPTRGFELGDDRTPTPVVGTEEIRAIARDVAVAVGNEAQKECMERGPICSVWKEIGAMRGDIRTLGVEQTKLLAVLGFWKWALPVVVALVGIAAGVLAPRILPVHQSYGPPHPVAAEVSK